MIDFAIPELPAMPPACIEFMQDRLAASDCFLEYGAGGSTRLAARLNVRSIYSVESDAAFMQAVEDSVKRQGETRSRLHTLVQNIGATGEWGYPLDSRNADKWPEYPLAVWDLIRKNGDSPDLILIDGRFRPACMLASILHARVGATIVLDDYVGREERYGVVMRYAEFSGYLDRMAIFHQAAAVDLRSIAIDLARYCVNPA